MRVVLATAGTRGDMQPMLALGQHLRARGHAVTLAAAPCFAADSAAAGVPFHPMGRDIEAWLRAEAPLAVTPWALFRLLQRAIADELHQQFDVLPRLVADADLVVAAGAAVGACSVAAALGVPARYAAFSAQSIPSKAQLPTVWPFQNTPRCFSGVAWWTTKRFFDRLLLAPLNARRRALGLGAARQVIEAFLPPGEVVLAADVELSALPPGSPVLTTGAWSLDDPRALPDGLLAFLQASEEQPIFVSFGSMPDADPRATASTVIRSTRAAGRRVIIGGAMACVDDLEDVYCLRAPVSHRELFPRVAVVVHHGGAGTTATAARAGTPQVLVPHGGDQFGFARRAHQLGIAPAPLRRGHLERLGPSLREALSPRCLALAAQLGETLAPRDGRAMMVDHLEALTG